ncbi:MAG: Co2+/Mg2+ efflux protein ApaG [Nitrosomonadales bacterium]|nr:Co2+/Mg2+ efflux protein ApaG [Nitrosomonadales bacterium]
MNTDEKLPSIAVSTQVRYMAEQSDESCDRYIFSYTITISNLSEETIQLLSRHWIITDANHQIQEVRGKGVVGEQPVLKSRQSFEYTSGTVLPTPVGTMHGSYTMQADDGTRFEIAIPQFVLSVPRVLH